MPSRCTLSPDLPALLLGQDQILTREQAVAHGVTPRAIAHRLRTGQWRIVLPGVYLTHPGELDRRERMIAARVYAGAGAAIDGNTACRDFYGMESIGFDERVFVRVPQESTARSRDFVVVRRSNSPSLPRSVEPHLVVDPATAVVAVTRRMRADRPVLAAMSEVVQKRLASYAELYRAHLQGPPRNAGYGDAALAHLGVGVRSAPEGSFHDLASSSVLLPPALYNCQLELPGGRCVSPDALFVDAGLVHETNGRRPHAREDLFEDMQERHDAMTAAGLVVLHNSPRRLWRHPRVVLAEVERCYALHAGRGLPPGVKIIATCAC